VAAVAAAAAAEAEEEDVRPRAGPHSRACDAISSGPWTTRRRERSPSASCAHNRCSTPSDGASTFTWRYRARTRATNGNW